MRLSLSAPWSDWGTWLDPMKLHDLKPAGTLRLKPGDFAKCLLSGVKRTSLLHRKLSACDGRLNRPSNSGHWSALGRDARVANDPKQASNSPQFHRALER